MCNYFKITTKTNEISNQKPARLFNIDEPNVRLSQYKMSWMAIIAHFGKNHL